jgi:hypothetical protein
MRYADPMTPDTPAVTRDEFARLPVEVQEAVDACVGVLAGLNDPQDATLAVAVLAVMARIGFAGRRLN